MARVVTASAQDADLALAAVSLLRGFQTYALVGAAGHEPGYVSGLALSLLHCRVIRRRWFSAIPGPRDSSSGEHSLRRACSPPRRHPIAPLRGKMRS